MRLAAIALILALGAAGSQLPARAQAPGRAGASAPAAGGGMVVAANPLAVDSGVKILRAGGSAVDAAIAVQATLGLVEPQSSGPAGGAFMTYYDAKTKEVTAYDGRETAPASATATYFFDNGRPLGRGAVRTGKSTGAPGVMAMLAMAQADHGKLKWADLFSDAEH